MGGEPVRLGPFTGGLNTISDPTTIADVELAECLNFEQDLDGSLKSRTPFKEVAGHTSFTERILFISEAVFGTDHYLIGSNVNGVWFFLNGAFTLITSTFEAGAAVQYADKVYLIPKPGSANPGGKWDPTAGFTAVAAIPQGQAAVVHKERLYICPGVKATVNASRLKFSDPSNLDSYPAGNFIDIRQGDGTKLVDLTVYQDNLLLFKEQSSHLLAYDTRPDDAVLRPISDTIGVNRQWNVVNYENQVYIFSGGWVYEITNLDFLRLNVKVPFIRDDTVPSAFSDEFIFLCLLGDRLICRYYRKVYVYGLRTRSWSEWGSVEDNLHYFGPIATVRPSTGDEFYAGSCVQAIRSAVKFLDKHTALGVEEVLDPTITITEDFNETVSNGWDGADTGQTWTVNGGAASDYSKNGTKGLMSLGSVNVQRTANLNNSTLNTDLYIDLEVPALALGSSIVFNIGVRTDLITFDRYRVQVDFNIAGNVVCTLQKVVLAVTSTIGGPVTIGAYAANQQFTCRLQANGTTIRSKLWPTANAQPLAWDITATDGSLTNAGGTRITAILNGGNTNILPIVVKFDNLRIGDFTDVVRTITCSAKTKNFDMAISHQFKRLWWWGASVSTNNPIKGLVTPITTSFLATWDDLANFTWDDLFTWDQPLQAPTFVQTVVPTGQGVVRQAVKFLKSLRYIQVNFKVELTTIGSTVDGPAKLFTMIAWTEPKQVVSKAVS